MQVQASIRPLLVAGLGVAMLSCMDATVKIVSAAYPIGEVVGLRYATGALFAAALFMVVRERRPDWITLRRNFLRACIVVLTAASFFTALARLPLAETVALTFLAPLLMSLLGWLLLKEPISPATTVGIALGLVGVMVIASDTPVGSGRGFDLVGIAAALACAFFYALSNVLMRKQSGVDSVFTIVALSNICALALATPMMVAQWEPPSRDHLAIFVVVGLFGTLGQVCMAWAYGRAQAGKLGVLEYTAFLWAALLGYFVFAEWPSGRTMIGAALILGACMVATWTEARRPRKAPLVEGPH